MLTLLLLISTALAGDVPDFVPPDASLLAALPAEQREMLLSAQLADNEDPQGEERLLMALLVSQRFGPATSADTPELLPTLVDALSEDSNTRGAALARAGTTQATSVASAPTAEVSLAAGIQVSMAPKNAVLRSASGRKLPKEWRYLRVVGLPSRPGLPGADEHWAVVASNGFELDALDLARVLQLQQHEDVLTARRRRMVINLAVGGGLGATGLMLTPSLMWFAPVLGLATLGLGLGGIGMAIASPLIWKHQKREFDRWFDRDDLLKRIEAHNLYWSAQMPVSASRNTRPPVPPVSAAPPAAAAAPEPAPPPAEPAAAPETPAPKPAPR